MKIVVAAALLATSLVGSVAHGQTAATAAPSDAPVKAGVALKSADGRRLGLVDRVQIGSDGKPSVVELIWDGRIVRIPAGMITPIDKSHFVTSLTYKQVREL